MMKRSLSLRLSRKDFGGKNNMETFGAVITNNSLSDNGDYNFVWLEAGR